MEQDLTPRQVIKEIDSILEYACHISARIDQKRYIESLYYIQILYEFMEEAIKEYEASGSKPHQELVDTLKNCIDDFNLKLAPVFKENMTNDNKSAVFLINHEEKKKTTQKLKEIVERNLDQYNPSVHEAVTTVHDYLFKDLDNIEFLFKIFNELMDKFLVLVPKCEQLWR